MSEPVAVAEPPPLHRAPRARLEALDSRALFLITIAVAAVIYAQFQFWRLPLTGDRANWDYFAQVIVRGGVPYRDVVNIKSPFSAYISAAAIVLARPFGVSDEIAIRLAYLLLGALTAGFTFLVAFRGFGSRRVALLAALLMLTFNSFGKFNSVGTQPKTPMVLFGLIALWAVLRGRPFLAGVFSMLSALSWQPGLLFFGAAGLAFSRYLTNWRDRKVLYLAAGAAAPLAILLAYLWAMGALRDFYLWNIDFNYTVYAPRGRLSLANFIDKMRGTVTGAYGGERLFFYLAVVGVLAAIGREVKRARAEGIAALRERAPIHAVLVAPAVYFFFCMVNIQGNQDFIPFLPFVGIFSALAIVVLLDLAAGLIRPRPAAALVESYGYVVILALVFVVSVADVFFLQPLSPTLADQRREVAEIVSYLQPGDKIFVHGETEILALSGLPNASRHFFLDRGKDNYLDRVEPGGFDGWFARLKAERPKIVSLSRMTHVDRKKDFFEWVRAEYEKREGRIFTYYVRKEEGQLRKQTETEK